jgi:hypothetical protein
MTRFISAVVTAVAISGAALLAQAQAPAPQPKGTEKMTPQTEAAAKNLMQSVSTVGCVRLWQPAPDDPTKMPPDRQPGLAGIYLLTPLSSTAATETDMPTYLLTPSATLNFSQHVGHKVEITGTAQTAPLPPTVQEIANSTTMRPENKPSTNGMPRLTATTLKMLTETCP